MKSFFSFLFVVLLSGQAQSSTQAEKAYQIEFTSLNEEIKHELLYGNLSQKSFHQSIMKRVHKLAPLSKRLAGAKQTRLLIKSFKETLAALAKLNSNYKTALNMVYPNGMSGREILIEATDLENNKKIIEIYDHHKAALASSLTGSELKNRAMDLTLEEIRQNKDFNFLNLGTQENFVLQDPVFSFINKKCKPRFGEEDFFLLLFGMNRCYTDTHVVNRYSVGVGYYNATSGYSYVTGLKIGRKSFYGVGATVKLGVHYAGGIGVFIGNGLLLTLDLEKSYGIYAGGTYLNLKAK